jgi:hypothetical protein
MREDQDETATVILHTRMMLDHTGGTNRYNMKNDSVKVFVHPVFSLTILNLFIYMVSSESVRIAE